MKMKTIMIFLSMLIGIIGCTNTPLSIPIQFQSSDWKIVNVTDNFGDTTGEKGIINLCKGTFDNSATQGSNLIVKLCVFKDSVILIELYEYESLLASFDTHQLNQTISIKLNDGTLTDAKIYGNYTGTLSNGIYDIHRDLYKLLLSQKDPFKCMIRMIGSVYNFTINPEGFKEAITKIE
jgi:hypothetical protein